MYPQPFPQTREVAGVQGGSVVLGRGTVSAVAQIDVTWRGIYDQVIAQYDDILPIVDRTPLSFRISSDGGVSYDAGAADYEYGSRVFAGAVAYQVSNSADGVYVTVGINGASNGVNDRVMLRAVIDEPADASRNPHIRGSGGYSQSTGANYVFSTFGGRRNAVTKVDGLRFRPASGTISGSYIVWGVRRPGR